MNLIEDVVSFMERKFEVYILHSNELPHISFFVTNFLM